jgi:hypothetical protein
MKKNMFIIPVLLVMFLFIFSVQQVSAGTWAKVTIERIGQVGLGSSIRLTHVSGIFTDKYFTFNPAIEKQLLATALTALSLNRDLLVNIKDGTNIIDALWVYN